MKLARFLEPRKLGSFFQLYIYIPIGPSVMEKRHPNWKVDVSAISSTNQQKVDGLPKT